MVFIALGFVDHHLTAAPSAGHSILARDVRSPSVGVHRVVCAILGDQQDMKHVFPRESDV
jgi:hypothetical protein